MHLMFMFSLRRGGQGFPTTVVEACASSVPVVVTNRTEAAEFVTGRFGLVVDYDIGELASAITRILDDKELVSYFRNNTRDIGVNDYSPEQVAKHFEQIYSLSLNRQN